MYHEKRKTTIHGSVNIPTTSHGSKMIKYQPNCCVSQRAAWAIPKWVNRQSRRESASTFPETNQNAPKSNPPKGKSSSYFFAIHFQVLLLLVSGRVFARFSYASFKFIISSGCFNAKFPVPPTNPPDPLTMMRLRYSLHRCNHRAGDLGICSTKMWWYGLFRGLVSLQKWWTFRGKSVNVSNHQPVLRVFWGSEIARVKYQYVVETYNYYMKVRMFQMVPTNSEHYHHPIVGYFKPRLYRSFFTPCNSLNRCLPSMVGKKLGTGAPK